MHCVFKLLKGETTVQVWKPENEFWIITHLLKQGWYSRVTEKRQNG